MLAKLVRDVIAGQLTVRPGMLNVRVNGQWNVVAADAATKEAMRTLLVPTTIYGIEVSPRELSSSSTGITVVGRQHYDHGPGSLQPRDARASQCSRLFTGGLQCICVSGRPSHPCQGHSWWENEVREPFLTKRR